MTQQAARVTVKAVVTEAARLRTTAESKRTVDPWARLYAPSECAARKLCQRKMNEALLALPADASDEDLAAARSDGAQAAIGELRFRAAQHERVYREGLVEESHRRNRHVRRLVEARKEKDLMRRNLSPLQRIATAAAQLQTVGAAQASNFDPRVTGSKDYGGPVFPGDPTARGNEILLRAARELEDEVETCRRRRVELEGRAA